MTKNPTSRGLRLRRILVPVDFSNGASSAVKYAAQVAAATGADLWLVHVAARTVGARGSEALQEAVREFSRNAGVWEPGVQVVIRYGSTAHEILEAAEHTRADMMVVATRSSSHALLPPIIGGTARALLRSFQGMILSIGEGAVDPQYPPRHVTVVMLGNAASRTAFDTLRHLVLANLPAVTVVAVLARDEEDDTDARAEDIKRHLEAYTGVELVVDALSTDRQTATQALLKIKTDMIVMGRNDQGEVAPNLLSTIARRVVRHAASPVLSLVSARLEEIDNRFRSIARTFTREELARSSSGSDESDQVLQELAGDASGVHGPLLLGLYGDQGLLTVFDRLGILDVLRSKGFDGFTGRIGSREGRDMGQLFCNRRTVPENLLLEVVEHVETIVPEPWIERIVGAEPFRLLTIEWVLMQNPRGTFTPERPPLPGQRRPGLGIGFEVAELFILAAERLGCDGLWSYPQFYHNARLYHERFYFVDPLLEGTMLALERDSAGHTLAEMSWAIELGLVTETHRGEVHKWQPTAQMLPLTPRARTPFMSGDYRRGMRKALATNTFSVNWDALPPRSKWPDLVVRAHRAPSDGWGD